MKQHIGSYEFDMYTRHEAQEDLKAAFGTHSSSYIRETLRGVKPIKLPKLLATASGTTLNLPQNQGQEFVACGPEAGYFWRIGRITIVSTGTDTGAVSLYAGSDPTKFGQDLVDNSLKVGQAYYPGTRGLFLWPGEMLYASLTSVSGNGYTLTGMAVEVPAEMAGKILV